MKVFCLGGYSNFEYQSKDISTGKFKFFHYHNGEPCFKIESNIKGEVCVVIATIAPPAGNLVNFCLLTHTLKKEGAKKIVAVLPYLGYSRQDRDEAGISRGTAWLGSILKASGVKVVYTLDLHSEIDKDLFEIPLYSRSTSDIFAKNVTLLSQDVTIVSPDKGSFMRAQELAKAAKISNSVVCLEKSRKDGIKHKEISGPIGLKVVIVDDILDSGSTLLSATKLLRKKGADQIEIAVTHGQFIGDTWKELFKNGVSRIYTTDSVLPAPELGKYAITTISIKDIITDMLIEVSK